MRCKAIDESGRPLRLSLGDRSTIYGVRMFRHLGFPGINLLALAGGVPSVRGVVGVGTGGGGGSGRTRRVNK